MLSKIIRFSVNNKLIIGLLTLAFIGWGIHALTNLPIDAVPDITENQVQIITISPSLSAPDIERQVTIPVELANRNIPGIKQVRSFSRFGLSLVTLVFTDVTDIYWARQQVSERLLALQAEIPPGIGIPELAPMSTGLGEIYQYVVRPKPGYETRYDAMELRTIQDHIVRKQLLGTPGVADVGSFGGKLKQYEIAIDPNKLAAAGLTINDIFTALENNNQNTGGAYIEKGPTVLFIRSEGLVKSIADIENIPITGPTVKLPLQIRDVAKVELGFASRYGALVYNDEAEVSGAVVMMLKGANSSQVISDVKKKVEEINTKLPEGVVIEPFLDRTKMVDNAIHTVEKNLIEGALIVIFVLVIFLGNVRAGLIVASVIPLSMLFAVIMMNLFGVSGNLMSLGAIDFGLIVDGAVIIVEAVMHKLHGTSILGGTRTLSQQEMDEEVSDSAGKMMSSAAFGQIIILMVYLPILSLQGIEGKMFKPMAETVAFALVGALLFSLTYVPMAASLFLSRKMDSKKTWTDKAMELLQKKYAPLLRKALSFPKTVITAAVLLFAVSVFIITTLGGEFIPQLEEGDFAVETRILSGSNLNTTMDNVKKAAGILKSRFPEVEKVVTKIGSGEVPTEPLPMDVGDMIITLKDKSEWTSAKTFPELAEKMAEAVSEVPGITTSFQFPVQMRFNELMTGARQDVVCKIYGDDLDSLTKYAQQMGQIIYTVDGAKDIYVETVTGVSQTVVDIKREILPNYGLSVADVNRTLNMAFAGQTAGYVYEGEKRFDLTVRMDKALRQQTENVNTLLVPLPNGGEIPLSEVADVQVKSGPYQIQRDNAKRRIIIGFNVRGRDVQSVVEELKSKVDSRLKIPTDYTIQYGGQFENLRAAKARLSIAVPVALLLILVLLYFAFRSLKHGLLIFSAIPLSAIGGVFALVLVGMPFSISAGVGFIALFGVAVLNGIVLIAEFNRLKKQGLQNLREIVMEGTKVRLRPVLMTATVASLGFLPMALSNGAGAEVQRPLATVVIGGLVTSTLLTLLVLPVLYVWVEGFTFRKKSNAKLALLVCFLALPALSQAQHPISLQHALDSALQNNLNIQVEKDMASVKQAMTYTGWDLPKTDINLQYGQYNSIAVDYNIGISQTLQFPTVYSAQTAWLKSEVKTALLSVENRKNEIRRRTRQVFYEWQVLHQRELLLRQADSLYAEFAKKSEFRSAIGETSLLESNAAKNQSVQIQQQLSSVKTEKENLTVWLKQLMNSADTYIPEVTDVIIRSENAAGTFPLIAYRQQVLNSASTMRNVEKAKLFPDLLIGYNNTGLSGIQNVNGTDIYYGPNKRFSYLSAGIGIPLFFGAQAARIKAAKIAVLQSQKELSAAELDWKTALANNENSIKNLEAVLNQYQAVILPNAKQNVQLADQQLKSGSIGYLEWIILVNQSIQSQSEYLNQVRLYNMAIIEKAYLYGN